MSLEISRETEVRRRLKRNDRNVPKADLTSRRSPSGN